MTNVNQCEPQNVERNRANFFFLQKFQTAYIIIPPQTSTLDSSKAEASQANRAVANNDV